MYIKSNEIQICKRSTNWIKEKENGEGFILR
jgi:hypothetical protein